jgi:hypothetical protein
VPGDRDGPPQTPLQTHPPIPRFRYHPAPPSDVKSQFLALAELVAWWEREPKPSAHEGSARRGEGEPGQERTGGWLIWVVGRSSILEWNLPSQVAVFGGICEGPGMVVVPEGRRDAFAPPVSTGLLLRGKSICNRLIFICRGERNAHEHSIGVRGVVVRLCFLIPHAIIRHRFRHLFPSVVPLLLHISLHAVPIRAPLYPLSVSLKRGGQKHHERRGVPPTNASGAWSPSRSSPSIRQVTSDGG